MKQHPVEKRNLAAITQLRNITPTIDISTGPNFGRGTCCLWTLRYRVDNLKQKMLCCIQHKIAGDLLG